MSDDDEVPGERRTAALLGRPGRGAVADDAGLPGEGAVVEGKYRVERVLGAGGMGVVVSAIHLGLSERVALKFVKVGPGTEELAERVRREARVAFRIKSQHVVRLLDVGTLPSGAPYLVMEHLEGRDLARELEARGPLPIAEAVDYALQACEAMAEAHGLGIVHRDLKPSNLFLMRGPDQKPLVKVLDFGIAKAMVPRGAIDSLTGEGSVLGSPCYMSPEQVRDARGVDGRTDVWSLGVIVQELVTGRGPFPLGPASAVFAAIAADAPERMRERRPEVPEALENVVLRALEKDPERRFETVCAFAAALAPFASDASDGVLERIASYAGIAPAPKTSDEPVPTAIAADAGSTLSAWNSQNRSPRRSFRYAAAVALVLAGAGASIFLRPRDSTSAVPARARAAISAPAPADMGGTASSISEPPPTDVKAVESALSAPPAPSTETTAKIIPPASRHSTGALPQVAPPTSATTSATSAPRTDAQGDIEERATSRRH